MAARTLTVLFSDLVDSTLLLSSLPPHDAQRLQSHHFAQLHEAIEQHAGRCVKTLGDGVMATYLAAEDAIDSATAMQLITTESTSSRSPGRLAIRVGVSSGDVREDDGDYYGLTVVEASRLCRHATGGQILVAQSTRSLARDHSSMTSLGDVQLKGLPEPTGVWEVEWRARGKRRLRVVLADDAVLVREGIARVLEERGIDVLAQAGDAEQLLQLTNELRPDVAIVDVRMPPTHRAEGLEAAEQILATHPRTGVLILSQDIEPRYAQRLLQARSHGVGYLLKERVANIAQFATATQTVADGGIVFEPSLEPQPTQELVASTDRRPVR